MHPEYWHRGYGTHIAVLAIEFAFADLGMHRVEATCDPRNIWSTRILERVGMTHKGTLRHTMELRDEWRDSHMFSILEEEWPQLPEAWMTGAANLELRAGVVTGGPVDSAWRSASPAVPAARATCAIGFPVSSTIRTAPSRNSRSYFFRFSGISIAIVDASTVRGEPQSGVPGLR